jgi:response regulator RpfG family c-di-GMP phosphodiesterase
MNKFIKRYCLLVIAQTICLALGLWLEQRFGFFTTPSESLQDKSAAVSVNADPVEVAAEADNMFSSQATAISFGVKAMTFGWIAVLQAVVAYLILTRDQEESTRKHRKAEMVSLQHYNEVLRMRDAVIFGLATLTESRDPETGNHLERIAIYSTRLASAVSRDSRYSGQVTLSFVKLIGISSALHDIGKVGVRDSILLKPGKLERQERDLIQTHVTIGSKCIREIELRLGGSNFLQMAREIALGHHERWDGTGYPNGLCGEEIPLAGRIVAIADVYDALSTKRIYKEALPHENCVEIIREAAGKQFDPALVEIFLNLESEFRDIAQNYRDVHKSQNIQAAPAKEISDIVEEVELSISDKLSAIQSLLVQSTDVINNVPPDYDLEPENVSHKT